MKRLITSESVSWGHPDKIADQISDSILDEIISNDVNAKVAIETMVKDNTVVLGGEVTTNYTPDYKKIVKNVIKDVGYSLEHGFHPNTITLINLIGEQSPEINKAVVKEDGEEGASDQGYILGFASNDTDNYMPLGIHISKKLIDFVVSIEGLGPDVKSQVTIEENSDGSKRIHTILISTFHPNKNIEDVRNSITKSIKDNDCKLSENIMNLFDSDTKIVINPAGSWTKQAGPVGDTGLTGRKIAVDQYSAYCPVGGGCFSGKYNHVDRIGAYLARYIAKNIVASGIASNCKVEISYMIGIPEPASINIDTFGSFNDDSKLIDIVKECFPLTPKQIIDYFDLKKPIYKDTAKNGHFGRTNLPWEKLDRVDDFKVELSN